MEILTVLDELYHVNPEDEDSVIRQLLRNEQVLSFRDGRKQVYLFAQNIVSIEYYKELK